MLQIHGRANSINVRKVLWLCAELGLPYQRTDWGRGHRPTSDPQYLALNPVGVVPTIVDDVFVLRESQAIIRYLAAKHGREDLYPSELQTRALIEQWLDWAATDLYAGVRPAFLGLAVRMPAFSDPDLIARAIVDWSRQMQVLESHLAAGNDWMVAGRFTLADIPVGLVVNRWYAIEFEKPELPAVAAYYERLSQRPAYREHGRNGMA